MERVKVGVVGCGAISSQYLENLVRRFPFCVEVVACADLVPEAAQAKAEEFGVPRVCTVDELMSDPEVELVVNLTVPTAHFEVNHAALQAGKHVYGEKPFTISREEGRRLLEESRETDRRIGGAPDTFLGAGLQTCRKLLDEGWIGCPVTAAASFISGSGRPGYYERYRGPVYDMAPYYLAALVSLLGPVKRAAGLATVPFPEKRSQNPGSETYGATYAVSMPANVVGVLEFGEGVVATLAATSEALGYFPRLEIYGTEGVLVCNDPNGFGGPVFVQPRSGDRREMPLPFDYRESNRGLGVADMACAIRTGRPHRASGELCCHVLDIMHALHDSSATGTFVELAHQVARPQPFPPGIGAALLDDVSGASNPSQR